MQSYKKRWTRSKSWVAYCLSVATVKKYAMTAGTGSKLKYHFEIKLIPFSGRDISAKELVRSIKWNLENIFFCFLFSEPQLKNVLINKNRAEGNGGGLLSFESKLNIQHATICDNKAMIGCGIATADSRIHLVNSILWGNSNRQIGF